jgi:hypothetical protein
MGVIHAWVLVIRSLSAAERKTRYHISFACERRKEARTCTPEVIAFITIHNSE